MTLPGCVLVILNMAEGKILGCVHGEDSSAANLVSCQEVGYDVYQSAVGQLIYT